MSSCVFKGEPAPDARNGASRLASRSADDVDAIRLVAILERGAGETERTRKQINFRNT